MKPHLLVDDFQNLTQAEYRLLQLIAGPKGSFTAAGDSNQRVGSWRGADEGILEHFRKDRPDCKHFQFITNHRFTPALHAFAAGLSEGSGLTRRPLPVLPGEHDSDLPPGYRPFLYVYNGSQDDLDHITAYHIQTADKHGFPWGDIALLCRRHSSIDRLVKVLKSYDIPHTIQGDDRGPVSQDAGNGITVSTFHASQGRRWPFVWLADVSEHIIPGNLGQDNHLWIGEERRLFYIAATRAAKTLFLSYCPEGGRASPTRFLTLVNNAMDTEVVEPIDS